MTSIGARNRERSALIGTQAHGVELASVLVFVSIDSISDSVPTHF
jgi:hypothetical protein